MAKKIVGKQFTVEIVKAKGQPTTKPRAKAPIDLLNLKKGIIKDLIDWKIELIR